MIIWLTGNSGSGKTTLAVELAAMLNATILDGDQMRHSISCDLGFEKMDREEHNLRVARLAKVLHQQGKNILVSVIAPFCDARDKIAAVLPRLKWVYVKREIPENADRPYMPPTDPDFVADMDKETPQQAANRLFQEISGLDRRVAG